jgi:hypothetical protein
MRIEERGRKVMGLLGNAASQYYDYDRYVASLHDEDDSACSCGDCLAKAEDDGADHDYDSWHDERGK